MKYNITCLYSLFLLLPLFSFANNLNEDVGNNWPLTLESSNSFDVASKCEMLVFIEVFNDYDVLSDTDLAQRIKVPKAKLESITQWKKDTKARLIANFSKLSDASLKDVICINNNSTWEILSALELQSDMPANFLAWYKATQVFYTDYIGEQLRLAALFPKITSEILQFSENEIQGHNFIDKHFLLTFDDGPTAVNGNTDKLIKVLNTYDLTGQFFVLGENLEQRLNATSKEAVKQLYGDNKVFSHGKVHKAHQKYDLWKTSIDYTSALINKIYPENNDKLVYFRPPYGQRNTAMTDYFTEKDSKIILWNIDSRDWSSKLNVQQVADRQIKLMLLWRHGILLFHDIHTKVQKVIPIIHNYFKDTTIVWMTPDAI
ncbi:polysaccharide deacetylase family protein [Olleya sp. HaHaR_3_96]|uniref:polysaccharide deacetylase family protein n=1 Tax=Olleya sp. HaHaR_3_96 TaxID=2745560 RepID=UPI001C4E7710|nr:polysaccharide deacetylase family protein [Olleya sp. HaHaR_3_96]QXP58575.1 polysaccharide deacetylase family protein [Olleya sp. HaHaR_3_96]